jgi:anti-sigma factor ChrR (cupin superfamily)
MEGSRFRPPVIEMKIDPRHELRGFGKPAWMARAGIVESPAATSGVNYDAEVALLTGVVGQSAPAHMHSGVETVAGGEKA